MAISLLPSSVRDYMAVHISLNTLQFCTLHGNYALILNLCFMSLSAKYRRIPHCYSGDGKIHAPLARFSCHRWCIGLTRFPGTVMSSPTTTLGSFWGEIYCSVQMGSLTKDRVHAQRNLPAAIFPASSCHDALCKLPHYSILPAA